MISTVPQSPTTGGLGGRPGTAAVLSFVAAGKLTSFAWLAESATTAPDLAVRELLSRAAADQVAQYDDVAALIGQLSPAPGQLESFLELLEEVGARTGSDDWWERLMRSVVIGGMVRDLDAALIGWLTPEHRERLRQVARGPAEDILDVVAPVLAGDDRLRARLGLWGRRIAGEALGILPPVIAQLRVRSSDAGGLEDGSAEAIVALHAPAMAAMSAGHARRMDRLQLTA